MENFGFLFAAYSAIFAAIFLYVVFIWNRQVRLDEKLRAMEAKLTALTASPKDEADRSGPDAPQS
jgi:CcmD family protein